MVGKLARGQIRLLHQCSEPDRLVRLNGFVWRAHGNLEGGLGEWLVEDVMTGETFKVNDPFHFCEEYNEMEVLAWASGTT